MDRTRTELTLHQIDDGTLLPIVRHFDHDGHEQVECLRDVQPVELTLEPKSGRETVLTGRIRKAA